MRKNVLPAALILAFLFLMEGFLSGCHASEPTAEDTAFVSQQSAETDPVPTSALTERPAPEPSPTKAPVRGEEALVLGDARFQPLQSDGKSTGTDLLEPGQHYLGCVSPMSDGVFWCQYSHEGDDHEKTLHLALCDETGKALFDTTQTTPFVSDFHDGSAFLTLAVGIPNGELHDVRLYDRIDAQWDVIIDKTGHTLYDTRWNADAEEEILCGGDGKYVAVRCVKGEDGKPLYTLGTIDPEGNVVDEFRPYTQAEGFGQNISAGIFHKSLRMFDETIVDTTLPYDPDPVYLGDGWYRLPGRFPNMLFNPGQQRIVHTGADRVMSTLADGLVFTYDEKDRGVYVFSPEKGKKKILGYTLSPRVVDGLCWIGGRLTDVHDENHMELDIPGDVYGCYVSAFEGNFAALTFVSNYETGSTHETYMSAVDRKGSFLFSPIRTESTVGLTASCPVIHDGRILFWEDSAHCFWLDLDGKTKEPVDRFQSCSDIRFCENGYLTSDRIFVRLEEPAD